MSGRRRIFTCLILTIFSLGVGWDLGLNWRGFTVPLTGLVSIGIPLALTLGLASGFVHQPSAVRRLRQVVVQGCC